MTPQVRRILVGASLSTLLLVLIAAMLSGSAWAFPARNNQSLDAPLEPAARYGHALVSSPRGGDVYLFGGNTRTGPANDVWRFNPASMGDNWELVTPLNIPPSRRFYQAATFWGDQLFIFGGVASGGLILDDVWSFNPLTNMWTQKPSTGKAPGPRYMHTATAFGDKIYIFGGYQGMSLADDHMYIYDPLSGVWQTGAGTGSSNGSRYGHSAVPTSFGISIFGGLGGMTMALGDWTYLPRTDTWAPLSLGGTICPPLARAGTAWRGNTAWTFGGEGPGGAETGNVAQVMCSSATICTCALLQRLPLPRADAQAVVLNLTGDPIVLVFGGRRGSPATPVAETFIDDVGAPPASPTPTQTRTPTVTRPPARTSTVTPTPSNTPVRYVHLYLPIILLTR